MDFEAGSHKTLTSFRDKTGFCRSRVHIESGWDLAWIIVVIKLMSQTCIHIGIHYGLVVYGDILTGVCCDIENTWVSLELT